MLDTGANGLPALGRHAHHFQTLQSKQWVQQQQAGHCTSMQACKHAFSCTSMQACKNASMQGIGQGMQEGRQERKV